MTEARFKTTPYAHQLRTLERSKDAEYFALFFEQRCGKTKVALDTAAHQFRAGRISALLVIAPNLVHVNWATDEIPTHLPDDTKPLTVVWRSGRMVSKTMQRALAELLDHPGLAILAVNVDALVTAPLREYLTTFFRKRKVMAVIDESLDISNHGAARTKIAMKVGARAVTRRILDGTPLAATPMGLFSQTEFLKRGALGFKSFFAFRARYAELEIKDFGERNRLCPACFNVSQDPPCQRCRGAGFVGKQQVAVVKNYRYLDELKATLATFSDRVTRAECADLPAKIYEKVRFELTPTQRRAYEQLRTESIAELQSGDLVTAQIVLTKLLRLQQLTSNFAARNPEPITCEACRGAGCEECGDLGVTFDHSRAEWATVDERAYPRLAALMDSIEQLDGQGIVWARFRRDLEVISAACAQRGWSYVRYDGGVTGADREAAKTAFQRGDARLLLGNQRAGGRGIDLSAASFVIYFSHEWSLRYRLQSEDRAQSLQKREAVLYLDIIGVDTGDEAIIKALRNGKSLSDLVTGDPSGDWI